MMFKLKIPKKLKGLGRKKKVSLGCALALMLCLGVSVLMPGGDETGLETAAPAADGEEITQEGSGVPLHDGDVLVDSLNITGISGNNGENAATTGGSVTETALVASDRLSESKSADEYFNELRATVDMDRNQIISMLTDVIAEAESSSEKDNASQQKLKIIEYMEKEKMIESLITSKGLPPCLVLITDNAVNVTVSKQELQQSDVAKICDIVSRETGRSIGEIVIQSKY